ncbi:MAG: hypothetical protein RLZZ214_2481 [Verrucomicrobiota bacterium]|jgi:hypothetical protein
MNSNDAGSDEMGQPEQQMFFRVLEDFALSIPNSAEPLSAIPRERAKEIVRFAGMKAGAVSATLALPPGPIGMLTIIPDLMQVWNIQRQMVSDIAACFGQSAQLNQQTMVYCLFRHGAAMLARDILVRVGERMILKRGSLRVIQKVLERVAIKVTQKAIGKSISRWVPIIGPIAVGGYSILDTRSVGKTAIDTFSRVIEVESELLP